MEIFHQQRKYKICFAFESRNKSSSGAETSSEQRQMELHEIKSGSKQVIQAQDRASNKMC